jgi:integrase
MAQGRSGFGNVRELKSGRWQARYTIPGTEQTVTAPHTFDGKGDAETWLAVQRADLVRGAWMPSDAKRTFGDYATKWLEQRRLKPRTRQHYRTLLDRQILPHLSAATVRSLNPDVIRTWLATLDDDTPTLNAHAYSLVRTICTTAVADRLLPANPCIIPGAGQAKRASKTEPASLAELEALVEAMPERYRPMTLLAAWCGLRFGELTELRGKDIDTRKGVIKVRRAVVWIDGSAVVQTPKSGAGVRDVAIPPHLLPALREHIIASGAGKDGLLFPAASGGHLPTSSLYRVFWRARDLAGRPDLRWHDLRHTGAVLAASTGATLAELMARLGHSTPGAAMRYQHAARGRDQEIAAALSRLAEVRNQ